MSYVNHNLKETSSLYALGQAGEEQSPLASVLSSLRGWLWGVGGVSFVINMLTLTGPLFMLQVYDRVLVSGSVPTLVAIGILALALYLFFGVLQGLRARVLYRIGQQVDAHLSSEAFVLSSRIPTRMGAKGRSLRPVQDLDTITQFMSGQGPAAIFDIPWLPFYLCFVFLLHSLLGFVALIGAVIILVLVLLNEVSSRKPSAMAARMRGRRGALVEESRRNADAISAMGMGHALSEQWNAENGAYLAGQRFAADRSGFYSSAIKTIRFILQSAMLATGAWLAIRQEISPGVMIASSIMTARALSPVEQAVAHWRGFVSARQSFNRLQELFRIQMEPSQNVELPLPGKHLSVEQLYCGPTGMRQPVIHGVSLDLAAGDGLAILGPSGSGKTTLAKAIVGTASLLKGDIRFDGATLDQWSTDRRGRIIGYLPQELQLFDGTIASNIARFDPRATSEEIIEAARLADVHDLIVSLPNGYDTIIGSEGVSLSGGQRQRIALARALFGNPFVLVLDEPNSNLDAEGEVALAEAVLKMREQGSIVILVAHRPRAIGAVNKVLCLKDGRVAAIGPKEEVMRKMMTPVQSVAAGRQQA
ncbi:type I secretion system permease/ATPase [uncultured Roseibium sp.]|uniref:type I secretion system permease/ATPase n=1 Tax=uncultured Roseibium sp. TaxID=1936171 RepID=UPI0032173471